MPLGFLIEDCWGNEELFLLPFLANLHELVFLLCTFALAFDLTGASFPCFDFWGTDCLITLLEVESE